MRAVVERAAVFGWAMRAVWRADRLGVITTSLLQGGGVISALGVVFASKFAIEAVTDGAVEDRTQLAVGLGVLAVAASLTQLNSIVQQLQQRLLGERVHQHVWDDLMRSTISVGLREWQDSTFTDRVDRLRNNAIQQPVLLVIALFTLLGSAATALGLVIALASLNPALVPVLLVVGVPAVFIARKVSAIEYGYSVEVTPLLRRRHYLERLMTEREGAAELRSYASGAHLLERHAELNRKAYSALRRHVSRRRRWALLGTGASTLALAATFGLIGSLLLTGRMSVAVAGAAAIAARLLSAQLSVLFTAFGVLMECGPFLYDLRDFTSLQDPEAMSSVEPRALIRGIELAGVSLTYGGQTRRAVDGVSLRIKAGQVVLLAGENGSGKSTLAKIVAGLYAPDLGTVAWDGDSQISSQELRASVSVLFQDFLRYQMSARDNVVIARAGDVDEVDLTVAAERANVAKIVEALAAQWDTPLGPELAGGIDLSGGQWQRLAIARSFYRDSPVLVLDEPTAALDPRAEWALMEDVRAVLAGRAALLISHRYSSARLADYIYLMSEGRIVEEGTFADLMGMPDGRFAELYRLQADAFRIGLDMP